MKRLLTRLMDVGLAVVAVVMVSLALVRLAASVRPSTPPIGHVPEAVVWAEHGHVIGLANAPVKIVEFSDFQCPYCAESVSRLRALEAKYPGKVAVVYRYFPLRGHPQGFPSAVAAECAGEQGRFVAYHDSLFAQQDSLGPLRWAAIAKEVGVPDLKAFTRCLGDRKASDVVRADLAVATAHHMNSTPTFYVGDLELAGPAVNSLESVVARAVAAANGR